MTTIIVYVRYTLLSGIIASMHTAQTTNDPFVMFNDTTFLCVSTSYDYGVITKKYELDLPYSKREILKFKLSYGGIKIKAGFNLIELKNVVINDGDTITLTA